MALLGKLGLVMSSFCSFSAAIFFWQADRLRLVRVVLILVVSVCLLVGAARIFRDSRYWRELIRSLPFIVGAFGCLGIVSTVADLYLHRQPHSVSDYETIWFFIGVVGFILSVFILKRRKRHAKHGA